MNLLTTNKKIRDAKEIREAFNERMLKDLPELILIARKHLILFEREVYLHKNCLIAAIDSCHGKKWHLLYWESIYQNVENKFEKWFQNNV